MMTVNIPPLSEQYKMAYRRAECESGMVCMIYAANRENALEAMLVAVGNYADNGIVVKMNTDKMDVYLPNGSYVHYGFPKAE